MKVRTISRDPEEFTRSRSGDVFKVFHNPDPKLHPFERAREYTRALTAVKLDKMFAKPFIGALEGHTDSVWSMTPSRHSLVPFLTGSCDGEIRLWDLPHQRTLWSCYAHSGFVRGLTVSHDGAHFFSCGDDKTIKQFPLTLDESRASKGRDDDPEPLNTWMSKHVFTGIDHHWKEAKFATSGAAVELWDHDRSEPVHTFSWGADSVTSVKFNPAEPCLLASTGSDRGICLFDVRGTTPMRKLIMAMKSNALAWNPMEPLNFTVANEDHNCYTYDMRNLAKAMMVHEDHVSAVMDVAYSPTGKEFVTGSYDRTIRIFPVQSGKSREVYHTKRMQRVFCVQFSADSKFVLSGSDDTNVRIWKAQASATLKRLLPRERTKRNYDEQLVKRFKHMPEVKRIVRHHHTPKPVAKAQARKREEQQKARRKLENVKKHSAPGTVQAEPVRSKAIVREAE